MARPSVKLSRLAMVLLLSSGCDGPGGGPAPDAGAPSPRDFGQIVLASLDEPCEGKAALTGQAVLDLKVEDLTGTLSYVTAAGGMVDPTTLTVKLTWPAQPQATCYPPYTEGGGAPTEPRVAIEGLTVDFSTTDGKFNETLPAKAWIMLTNGNPSPAILAVTTRQNLTGSWQPFAEYEGAGDSLLFFVSLAQMAGANGNVGLSQEDPAELGAAILKSRLAVAVFQ